MLISSGETRNHVDPSLGVSSHFIIARLLGAGKTRDRVRYSVFKELGGTLEAFSV